MNRDYAAMQNLIFAFLRLIFTTDKRERELLRRWTNSFTDLLSTTVCGTHCRLLIMYLIIPKIKICLVLETPRQFGETPWQHDSELRVLAGEGEGGDLA